MTIWILGLTLINLGVVAFLEVLLSGIATTIIPSEKEDKNNKLGGIRLAQKLIIILGVIQTIISITILSNI